jgi:hypothetical protein
MIDQHFIINTLIILNISLTNSFLKNSHFLPQVLFCGVHSILGKLETKFHSHHLIAIALLHPKSNNLLL